MKFYEISQSHPSPIAGKANRRIALCMRSNPLPATRPMATNLHDADLGNTKQRAPLVDQRAATALKQGGVG